MLPEHKHRVASLIEQALARLGLQSPAPVQLERPKVAAHGDLACTIALQIAKPLKKNPREVGQAIADQLKTDPAGAGLIDAVEIAGPGFINIRLTLAAKQAVVTLALTRKACFGTTNDQAATKVMVEFVSANPTGPLHLGHARQAALGDALANLLAAQGAQVSREFYYNDAGVQIDKLVASVQLRLREAAGARLVFAHEKDPNGVPGPWYDPAEIAAARAAGAEVILFPADAYRGEYIADIARDYLAKKTRAARDGSPVTASGDPADSANLRAFAVAYLREEQDQDLAALGVKFDVFYLESSLYTDGLVEAAVKAMMDSGLTYESEGALWLRTTAIEGSGDLRDDKDRVMRKQDGTFTYFVPDVAYHVTKFQRGFDKVINVQGSDHHGTVARVRAGLQAAAKSLGVAIPRGYPDYLLHKMVRVMKDGAEVKMSKRAGSYVTLRDLLDWVGRDATRFFLVSRKADSEFVFDVDLAVSKSDENPVFYVQYAHARIESVFTTAAERGYPFDRTRAHAVDLAPLDSPAALALLARLADYPDTLRAAAEELAPHHVAFYLKDLAADFHGFYNADRVLIDDAPVRNARLALLAATQQVLRNGLAVLGVSAPERM